MKANISSATAVDTMVRSKTFGDMYKFTVDGTLQIAASGDFVQELLDLIASRSPLPSIHLLEDRNGNWRTVGKYSTDLIHTAFAYIKGIDDGLVEDERHIQRRVLEYPIDLVIVRCSNEPKDVVEYFNILKRNCMIDIKG
jgi:hypothetical protein